MADNSVSPPPVADSTSPAPVAPPDQATQSTDIGQQPEGTWPNSTNLANLPTEATASAKVGDQQSTPPAEPIISELPKEETSPQAVSSEVGQVTATPPHTTWPDSTKMANENSADTSTSANPAPPTDQAVVSADSPIPSMPPFTPVEPVSSVPDGSPPTPSSPSLPPEIPTSVPTSESPTPEVTPEPFEATKPPEEKIDTNIQSSDNQTPQVQPEAPNEVPITDTEKPQDNMANFKPETPEQPQEAPLANQNVTDSSQKSFGDLLSSENQAPPAPSTPSIPPIPSTPAVSSVPSPTPSVSFGDLIKDIKPEESVIPPPPIPSEPAVSSSPPTQNPPPTPPVSSPAISPIPNLPPIANIPQIYQTPSAPSDQLSLRRQKANQVRSQKKAKHLNKIMELARNSKSISNTDIQRLLHVSQSTATNYLAELSHRGMLKREGIRGGAKYSL